MLHLFSLRIVQSFQTSSAFLWFGRGCSGDEREMGRLVAQRLTGDVEVEIIAEGQETHQFWAELGGQAEYASGKEFQASLLTSASRLASLEQKANV